MTEEIKEEVTKEEPKSRLDELKDTMQELRELQDSINKDKEELLRLREDDLLSSTAGRRPDEPVQKEESPGDYAKRVMSGGLNEQGSE